MRHSLTNFTADLDGIALANSLFPISAVQDSNCQASAMAVRSVLRAIEYCECWNALLDEILSTYISCPKFSAKFFCVKSSTQNTGSVGGYTTC